MADEEQMAAIVAELQNIRLILNQNRIGPVEVEEEIIFQQPQSAEQFILFAKTDIKNLPVFTGEGFPSLNDWLTDVAPIIENMDRLIPQRFEYHCFLKDIKRKIQGPAGAVLSNHGIALNWKSIKKTLVNHFADKRSVSVLEIEALTLRQGKNSLEFYFNQANSLLTKTIEAIRLSPEVEEGAIHSLMRLARDRILTCFINGLNPAWEQPCRAMKPKSLSEAYNICNEMRNANKLKTMFTPWDQPRAQRKEQTTIRTQAQAIPSVQKGQSQNPPRPSTSGQNWVQRAPKQNNPIEPRPVPMEIDPSIRINNNSVQNSRPLSRQSRMSTETIQKIFQLLAAEMEEGSEEVEEKTEEEIPDEEESQKEEEEHNEINFLA